MLISSLGMCLTFATFDGFLVQYHLYWLKKCPVSICNMMQICIRRYLLSFSVFCLQIVPFSHNKKADYALMLCMIRWTGCIECHITQYSIHHSIHFVPLDNNAHDVELNHQGGQRLIYLDLINLRTTKISKG